MIAKDLEWKWEQDTKSQSTKERVIHLLNFNPLQVWKNLSVRFVLNVHPCVERRTP